MASRMNASVPETRRKRYRHVKALQTAAQADDDIEVRHSAQFAAEVILTSGQR